MTFCVATYFNICNCNRYISALFVPNNDDAVYTSKGTTKEHFDVPRSGLNWIRLNDTPVIELKHVVDNLAPLTEYQLRVAAVNKFGIISFSEASEMITTKAP